jgi:hypothetical protein
VVLQRKLQAVRAPVAYPGLVATAMQQRDAKGLAPKSVEKEVGRCVARHADDELLVEIEVEQRGTQRFAMGVESQRARHATA